MMRVAPLFEDVDDPSVEDAISSGNGGRDRDALQQVRYLASQGVARTMGRRQGGTMKLSAAELVFAIAHEVGNHLGGIRLQAHLLDDDLDTRELAGASVLIDELAGRSGPLLSLLRPLLADEWREAGGARLWSTLLSALERQLQEEGTRGTLVEFGPMVGVDTPAPDHDWIHPLLIALLGATLSHVGRDGRILVTFESIGEDDVLEVADDGAEERLDEEAAARGRPLVVALARALVGRLGGSVETARDQGRTRVRLHFPRRERVAGRE